MNKFIFIFMAMLSGCAVDHKLYEINTANVQVSIEIDPMMEKPRQGFSKLKMRDKKIESCEIVLKRYPVCLAHEVRHCFEGDFHADDSTEDF